MRTVFVLLVLFQVALTAQHAMEFFLHAFYGLPGFPEFVVAAVVDGVVFAHCDSNNETLQLHEWTREFTNDHQDRLKIFLGDCSNGHNYTEVAFSVVMQLFNHSGGVHVLQQRSGCEWDEETGGNGILPKIGYDGEDLLSLDPQTLTWTALKPEALALTQKLNSFEAELYFMDHYHNHECPFELKEAVTSGRKFLQRKVLPSVSLLQKSPSSPVRCFATGFYPDRAVMFWRKDGEELHEGVDHGEILPNHDQTFQMSVDLNISSEKPGDWRRYECVFQLYGVMEDIVTTLDQSVIRSNNVPGSPPRDHVVFGVVAGLLLLSVFIAGFIMWRKKKNGEEDNLEMVMTPACEE